MTTFNELFPKTIYMNLDKRTDRRKLAEAEFARLGISPVRMNGVFIRGTSNPMIDGALGCMFAHILCLKYGLENNSNVFIFEDDIKFIDNIKELADASCDELSQVEWDMLYLSANILRPHHQVSPHLSRLNHAQSTVAYGVNINFIPKLLEYLPADLQHIQQPWIDVIYADTVVPKHNCYISIPMAGVQRNDHSDIMEADVRYEDYLQARYDANFVPLTK
jgi:GR25 family glycosyltransferase involved in LPS biosynthesis